MEPQPSSNPYDRPTLTIEQTKAAEEKRAAIIDQIKAQVRDGAYQKHQNVLYPHEVRALPDVQKQALAKTIVAWRNGPENRGFIDTLDLNRVLQYIEHNEVFAYIANGELLACARLHPDVEHQVGGRGRVVFGMAMKKPASFSTTQNPEAKAAFKHVAHARLVLCANVYPHLRPRTFLDSTNIKNIDYHLITLGLEEIKPRDSTKPYSPINIKLNRLVEPLQGVIKLPDEVMSAYTDDSTFEKETSQTE